MKLKVLVASMAVVMLAACSPLKDKVDTAGQKPELITQPEQKPETNKQEAQKPLDTGVSTTALTSAKPEIVPLQDQASGSARVDMSPLDDPNNLLSTRVIYFDYDSSDIDDTSKKIVAAHATHLAGHKSAKVVVEGHTDERGSREYNMALGDRRAQSVKQLLVLQGVGRDQIEIVSYGEEQPAVMGDDESVWAKNRRAEIVYTSR